MHEEKSLYTHPIPVKKGEMRKRGLLHSQLWQMPGCHGVIEKQGRNQPCAERIIQQEKKPEAEEGLGSLCSFRTIQAFWRQPK
jgi:hypothetical protein